MNIDLKGLRAHVKQLKARRATSPIGKIKTGATEVIRANFEEIERLHHEEGASWTEIASGLAAQGVTQGDGQPLTGRRLTALMHNVRTRARKLESKGAARNRTAIVSKRLQDVPIGKRVSLSSEMNRTVIGGNLPEEIVSEDEIRRTELAKHAHLLRKR